MKSLITFIPIVLLTLNYTFAEEEGDKAALFFEKKCFSCHNIGGGDKKGPDLDGLILRRKREWILSFVKSPSSLLAKGDSDAVALFKKFAPEKMPDQDISESDLTAILSLIDKYTKAKKKFVPVTLKLPRDVRESDIPFGRNLFTGEAGFSDKITPCIACHSVGSVGILGGGSLGPELTKSASKFSDAELVGILKNPTFPNMSKLLTGKKISDDELLGIVAFLKDSKNKNSTSTDTKFRIVLLGLLILFISLLFLNFLLRERVSGIRSKLVKTI